MPFSIGFLDVKRHGFGEDLAAKYDAFRPEDCRNLGGGPIQHLLGIGKRLLEKEAVDVALKVLRGDAPELGEPRIKFGHQSIDLVHGLAILIGVAGDGLNLHVGEAVVRGEGLVAGPLVGDQSRASFEKRQDRISFFPGLVADPNDPSDEGIAFVDGEKDANLVGVAGASVAAPFAGPRHVRRLRALKAYPDEFAVQLDPSAEGNRRRCRRNRPLQLLPQHERRLQRDAACRGGCPEWDAGELAFHEAKPFPGVQLGPHGRPRSRRGKRLAAPLAYPFLVAVAIGSVLRHGASAGIAERPSVLAEDHSVGTLGVGKRQQLGKDVELVLEHRFDDLGYFVGFHAKKAFGQPTVADSIAKPSPWLAEQRHPPFGRSLLGRFGLAFKFYTKIGGLSVDMSNRA